MSRRSKWTPFLTAPVVALVLAGALQAQSRATATNVPEIPIQAVEGFFKLPDGMYFGEGIGIATNSQGHIFVYHRSGDTRLFEFDADGNFVRELGVGI